jgi:hypothetical protein
MTPRTDSSPPRDDDLRSRFEALRRVDEKIAPEFGVLISRASARKHRSIVLPAALAAAAVVIAIVGRRFVTGRSHPDTLGTGARPTTPSIVSWQSPTASLLQTPGLDLLRTVPTLRSSLLRGTLPESLLTRHPGA